MEIKKAETVPDTMGLATRFAGFLASIGLPAATVLAVLLIALELFGGLAILLGIFTRLAAALLTIEMVVAIFTVHLSHGFQQANGGWEWPFAVFGGTLAIALAGPGKLALASRFTRTRRSALTPAIE